jgi:magnesium transporter
MKNILLNRKKIQPSHVFTGEKKLEDISLQRFVYNASEVQEEQDLYISKVSLLDDDGLNQWINIYGIHDPATIEQICHSLGIHALVIQDILDVNQRPKFQEFEDYWFFTLKSVLPEKDGGVITEQISFVLGKNYLLSFQEVKADYFAHIRERLRKGIGIVRGRSVDYLLYLMLEAILDNYFKTLDRLEKQSTAFRLTDINQDPGPDVLHKIEMLKQEVNQIKKTIVPIREFVSIVERENFGRIHQQHEKYFFELKDMCLSLLDACDQQMLNLESNVNLFFSVQGHRMNQVMKTLTVVASIFIPLTFIAGIYGMNFDYMPETKWHFGYFAVWIFMVISALLMMYYFKRKKWF